MTFRDGGATENKYFDQPFCGKVVRIGAIACAATLAGNVLILLLVDPSHSRCAGWAIQGQNGSGSIWGLIAAVGLWAAWIGYCAIRWDWVARRYVDRRNCCLFLVGLGPSSAPSCRPRCYEVIE